MNKHLLFLPLLLPGERSICPMDSVEVVNPLREVVFEYGGHIMIT